MSCVWRLYDQADYLDMEWTVGPLIDSHDVCLSIESDVASGAIAQCLRSHLRLAASDALSPEPS